MNTVTPRFSLIISTIGKEPMTSLLNSIASQENASYEVIVVDQSENKHIASQYKDEFSLLNAKYIKDSGKGASRGRNIGLNKAIGDIVFFPDDDCWFSENLLSEISCFFKSDKNASFIATKLDDPEGTGKIAAFKKYSCEILESNIFSTHVESSLFIKKSVLDEGYIFNENYGVGTSTNKRADEGPELLLRLLRAGKRGFYKSNIIIRHPSPFNQPNKNMAERAYYYCYARGALVKEAGLPKFTNIVFPILKHLTGIPIYILIFRFDMASYYLNKVKGRLAGYWFG